MICITCQQEKGIDFYKCKSRKSGFVSYCKSCFEIRRKKNLNPEIERKRIARWQKKTKYKSLALMREKYPEKYKARWAMQYAVRSGKINKPTKCNSCQLEIKLEGHHEDYSKPLDVVWLCKSCHTKKHFRKRYTGVENHSRSLSGLRQIS